MALALNLSLSGYGSPMRLSTPTSSGVPKGLKNMGNSCYINAVLQSVAHCELIYSRAKASTHSSRCQQSHECVLCAFERCVVDLKRPVALSMPPNAHIMTRLIKLLPSISSQGSIMTAGRQEDAHEFFSGLISTAQNCRSQYGTPEGKNNTELNSSHNKNYLLELFQGKLYSGVFCIECGAVSSTTETIQGLELEIGRTATLEGALSEFCSRESLQQSSGNAYACERCQTLTAAEKCLRIAEVPQVLRIQLKRFSYARDGGGCRKLSHLVEFPDRLDMQPYVQEQEQGCYTAEALQYRLNAVIVHIGRTPDSGHYAAYVRHRNEWFLVNDDQVQAVSLAEVQSQAAYILLYERAHTTTAHSPLPTLNSRSSLNQRLHSAMMSPTVSIPRASVAVPAGDSGRFGSNPMRAPLSAQYTAAVSAREQGQLGMGGANTSYLAALQQRRADCDWLESNPLRPAVPTTNAATVPTEEQPAPHKATSSTTATLNSSMSAASPATSARVAVSRRKALFRSLNFFSRSRDINSSKRKQMLGLQGLGHHLDTPTAGTGKGVKRANSSSGGEQYFAQQHFERPEDSRPEAATAEGDATTTEEDRMEVTSGSGNTDIAVQCESPKRRRLSERDNNSSKEPAAQPKRGSWLFFIPKQLKAMFTTQTSD